jgi:hypothetical protein
MEVFRMTGREVVDRLIAENPSLHFIAEKYRKEVEPYGLKPGLTNFAVRPEVLGHIRDNVPASHLTLETGAGQTTVAFAALARHHFCIAPDTEGIELILQYLDKVGVPRDKVTFIPESSDVGLRQLSLPGPVDYAFIDGCHGYPFPALDWHHIDRHLRVGGLLGVDNTELRSVRNHCDFLEENGSYRLVYAVCDRAPCTSFYVKVRDEEREWIFQPYNLQTGVHIQKPPVPAPSPSFLRRVRRWVRRSA